MHRTIKRARKMQGKEVTVILTSCGRFDLLHRTIESFLLHNTYSVKEFIIYEDSAKGTRGLKSMYPFIKWIQPDHRTGQICALDTLWSLVKNPYAFTLEDDWEFCKGGFIEQSMAILESDPTIMQVWLQPLEQHNAHPIEWGHSAPSGYANVNGPLSVNYGLMAPLFSAIRFNPSLKRKSDYDLIAPFSNHTTWNAEKPWKCEADIAKVYTEMGYRSAILPDRYIKHIGEGRHISA
jgi:hypothetical protein